MMETTPGFLGGATGRIIFALGLCAAGVSSCLTCPFSLSIAVTMLMSGEPYNTTSKLMINVWRNKGLVWKGLIVAGIGIGLIVSVVVSKETLLTIILGAQVVNGFIL